MEKFDILVIGAGAAGLTAANELSKSGLKVAIIEARNRTGGRIHTITGEGFIEPVETGAEFVHGQLPLTLSLLKQYNIKIKPTGGEMWRTRNGQLTPDSDYVTGFDELDKRLKELKNDMSVDAFLFTHFPGEKYQQLRTAIRRFVEGFDTADPSRASTFKLREEWGNFEEEGPQYRVEGGYTRLIEALENDCTKNGCEVFLSEPATEIRWAKNSVQVLTANSKQYEAAKVVITVPLSVLLAPDKSESAIVFVPVLPTIKATAQQLAFGSVIKIILQFTNAFWTTKQFKEQTDMSLKHMGFLFTDTVIPTWWTQYPIDSPILTGWIGGPAAKELKDTSEEELFEAAIHTLTAVFGEKEQVLKSRITKWKVINWSNQPFTKGSYSYTTLKANEAIGILKQPIENTVFFAGEALYIGEANGTVEAAITTGYDVAKLILDQN